MLRSPNSPSRSNGAAGRFLGRAVVDERGSPVGTVSGVVLDGGDREPSWLIVETRWWGTRRYVPVAGSYGTAGGGLTVPFDRAWVRAAPKAGASAGELTYEKRRQLATHYGDTYEWWPRRRLTTALVAG